MQGAGRGHGAPLPVSAAVTRLTQPAAPAALVVLPRPQASSPPESTVEAKSVHRGQRAVEKEALGQGSALAGPPLTSNGAVRAGRDQASALAQVGGERGCGTIAHGDTHRGLPNQQCGHSYPTTPQGHLASARPFQLRQVWGEEGADEEVN